MSAYDSIVVGVDGSDPAETAIRHAVGYASEFDARLLGVAAVVEHELSPLGIPEHELSVDEDTKRSLTRLESLAGDAGVPCETVVERGVAHETVLDNADRVDADLVALGTHGRTGFDRLLLGSVAERTLRTSDVPVLTTHAMPEGSPSVRDVLVPTDGSDCAERAVDHALQVARRFEATVHALSVVDVSALSSSFAAGPGIPAVVNTLEEQYQETVDAVAERAEEYDLVAETAVTEGAPARVIRGYVDDHGVDLVAMGTHGRSGFSRQLIGSVAERVVRTSDVPVMAVPP